MKIVVKKKLKIEYLFKYVIIIVVGIFRLLLLFFNRNMLKCLKVSIAYYDYIIMNFIF